MPHAKGRLLELTVPRILLQPGISTAVVCTRHILPAVLVLSNISVLHSRTKTVQLKYPTTYAQEGPVCLSPGVLAIPPSTPAERASSFKTAGLTSESKFESQTTLSKKSGGGSSGGRSGGSGGSGGRIGCLVRFLDE